MKEIDELKEMTKDELIEKVMHWKSLYDELSEYIEKTYHDYG